MNVSTTESEAVMSLLCSEGETYSEPNQTFIDEGIEDLPDSEGQTSASLTPEVATANQSMCDSGYSETLNLQCLECVLEWPIKSAQDRRTLPHVCLCFTQEHTGFEDYVDDIYFHRLSREQKYHVPRCLDNQTEVTPGIRGLLVQWMTSVHHELSLCQDSLFLAVNIIDRVLDVMLVSRDCLELLGATSLLIACKQNEVVTPEIVELLEKCRDKYNRTQFKQLEMIVLMATHFDLSPPTVQEFLEYFASFSLAARTDDQPRVEKLKVARALGRYMVELSLQEYDFCQFRPSLLAICMWKSALEYYKLYGDTAVPPGVTFTEGEFQLCRMEVQLFTESFMHTCPDINLICERYLYLYGTK